MINRNYVLDAIKKQAKIDKKSQSSAKKALEDMKVVNRKGEITDIYSIKPSYIR